jgi:hypothetical protein
MTRIELSAGWGECYKYDHQAGNWLFYTAVFSSAAEVYNLFWLTLYPHRDGSTQMGNKGSAVGALKP